MMPRPRALILTHHLFAFGGSELVAVEFANAMANHGADVAVHSPFFEPDFVARCLQSGVVFIEQPAEIKIEEFDLVYCQHQVASSLIVERFSALKVAERLPYIVYNHLSPFEPFEFPGPFIEAAVADEIWCNSAETARELERFGDRFTQCRVVPNPAPGGFLVEPDRPARINRLLSISNHLPDELRNAFDILENNGVKVIRIGRPDHARRVTPHDISASDAIISIGKSVQYALLGRRPVYCYDWFGGPGWLTAETFERAADRNFSGRCCRTVRSAEDIAEELVSGFGDAHAFVAGLPDDRLKAYAWPNHIRPLLARLQDARSTSIGRLRQTLAACSADDVPGAWRHEVDLYKLIDREYDKARRQHKRNEGLVRQIARLKADESGIHA